ncbi:MAG: glycosyltransferase, partial [Deltaproteobacteria bacterium]
GVRTVVHTVHGWSFNDLQPAFVRMLYRRLERLCANFTSTIVVVSENDRDRGLKAGIGRQEQYALIRYGINAVRYSETDGNARKEWGIADGRYCIGNISCLKPQKAPLDYIEYCVRVKRKLPGCKFVLVGDGELRPKVEKMISARGMERDIILTGWRRDIPGLLASFDMLVLTSLWEGLPIAVLESLAAGKPVAATDTGGIREVIDDGRTGLLVSPRDMDSLAEKTVRLLQDRDKMSSIARAARAKLGEEYSLEGMAARLSRVYTLSTPYEKHGPRV